MIFKGNDLDVDKLVDKLDIASSFITYRNNDIFLSRNQINVLMRNQINYKKYSNLSSLIFDIEEAINSDIVVDEELETLLENLAEFNYYKNTKK